MIEYAEPLLEGFKLWSKPALLFTYQFLARRTVIIFSCFFMNAFPSLQAILFMQLSFAGLVYLGGGLPYADMTTNYMELQNELTIYFASFHALALTTLD